MAINKREPANPKKYTSIIARRPQRSPRRPAGSAPSPNKQNAPAASGMTSSHRPIPKSAAIAPTLDAKTSKARWSSAWPTFSNSAAALVGDDCIGKEHQIGRRGTHFQVSAAIASLAASLALSWHVVAKLGIYVFASSKSNPNSSVGRPMRAKCPLRQRPVGASLRWLSHDGKPFLLLSPHSACVMMIGGVGWMAGPACVAPTKRRVVRALSTWRLGCGDGASKTAMEAQSSLRQVTSRRASKGGLQLEGYAVGDPLLRHRHDRPSVEGSAARARDRAL